MRRALVIVALAAALAVGVAAAAPGGLDPSFGTGGVVSTDFAGGIDQALGVALDAQGRLVVIGEGTTSSSFDFAAEAARYSAAGSLDTTFGTGGKLRLQVGLQSSSLLAVAVQPDGKIVAVGQASDDGSTDYGFVLRLNSDGTLDSSFASNGVAASTDAYSLDSIVLQPNGSIVAGGFTPGSEALVERFTSTGALDPTFGSSGEVSLDFGSSLGEFGGAVALQPDGKIILGADVAVSDEVSDFGVARLTSTGNLDPSFGGSGYVMTAFANASADLASLAIQPDGKIVAGGELGDFTSTVTPSSNMGLARYNANGSLDTSLGSGGTVNLNLGQESPGVNSNENIRAIALQTDGKIIAIGSHSNDGTSSSSFQVARFTSAGALDPTFGTNGIARGSIDGDDRAFAGLLQPDGKIVAVGAAATGPTTSDFGVARFLNDVAPVTALRSLASEVSASSINRATKTRLTVELDAAIVLAPHPRLAAVAVGVFIVDVRAQSGRAIPAATAFGWVAEAQQIRAQLIG
jgi:uncharacterized delta-60 repeat protein